MATHEREVWIDAPKEKVWAALADFGNIYVFNPNVPTSYSTSEKTSGLGATRHCDLRGGVSVEERIIDWQEGESMVIEIYDGAKTPPFKSAIASISVKEERGGTLVSGTLAYKIKFGPVGTLMDKAMVSPQFGKAWTAVLAGLKTYIETGEEVPNVSATDFTPVAVIA